MNVFTILVINVILKLQINEVSMFIGGNLCRVLNPCDQCDEKPTTKRILIVYRRKLMKVFINVY